MSIILSLLTKFGTLARQVTIPLSCAVACKSVKVLVVEFSIVELLVEYLLLRSDTVIPLCIQVIVGSGCPVAEHEKVTLAPSTTVFD